MIGRNLIFLILLAAQLASPQVGATLIGPANGRDERYGILASGWPPVEASLKQVHLIHRHGDRTPTEFPPKDPLREEPFWSFHGIGQLTNRGKSRVYLLGKIFRQHYDSFFNHSASKHLRVSRSSAALRCIESAQLFLASFLGLEDLRGNEAANQRLRWNSRGTLGRTWQPASVLSVPVQFDGMLAESSTCEERTKERRNVIEQTDQVKAWLAQCANEISFVNETLGWDIRTAGQLLDIIDLASIELYYFGDKLEPELRQVYERLQVVGQSVFGVSQLTPKSRRLQIGLLLGDVIKHMKQLSSGDGKPTKPFYHYATHDTKIINLLGALGQWQKYPAGPEFASSIIFELHQDASDGQWHVKLFYLRRVTPLSVAELHLDRCEQADAVKSRCLLDRFEELMREYVIEDWQTWMDECGNDIGALDPYGDS